MVSVLLSLAIVLVLASMGDWLRRWLMSQSPGSGWVERFVLSAWTGLVLVLLAMINWYHLLSRWSVKTGAWPIAIALTGLSIFSAFRWRPARQEGNRPATAWPLLVVPTIGLVLISSPFFGQDSPGFYFANNSEYVYYSVIADVVKHHAAADIVRAAVVSRESVVAAGAAFFSTLFRVPIVFILQPFANAIGWLSFACLGVLFHGVCRDLKAGQITRGAVFVLYALAIFSAANQQFWILSVLSHYISTVVFFGLVALLLVCRSDLSLPGSRRGVVAIGLSMGVLACAYPDMLIPYLGMLFVFDTLGVVARPSHVRRLMARWGMSVVVAAVVANRLAWEILPSMVTSRLTVDAGWDIFGHTEAAVLFGNFVGLSNLFYDPKPPGFFLTTLVVVTVAAAVLRLGLTCRQHVVARQLLGLMVAYLAGVTLLFGAIILTDRFTNYVAAKFTIGFLWVAYLGTATALATRPRMDGLKWVVIAGWAAMAGRIVSEADLFSVRLAEDAKTARVSQRELSAIRNVVGPARRVAVVGSPENMEALGNFLIYGEDLLSRGQLRLSGNNGRWIRPDVAELNGQRYAITLGLARNSSPVGALATEFRRILEHEGFALWERQSYSARTIRTVKGSSSYAGSDAYSAARAFDRDERTGWAASGSAPASVDVTPENEGVLQSIVFEGRGDETFYETWQEVRVRLFHQGRVVADQVSTMLNAPRERYQQVTVPSVLCDRILLDFDDPVTTTVKGEHVSPKRVNPGYSEIVLRWKD